jgi:hypothetical protein
MLPVLRTLKMQPLRAARLWSILRLFAKSSKDPSAKSQVGVGQLPVELLQEIFSYLDIWTLLRIRAVCRLWAQNVPGNSPALRKSMFAPSSAPELRIIDAAMGDCTLESRVMILGPFGPWRKYEHATDYVVHPVWSHVHHLQERGITINPMLLFHMRQSTLTRLKQSCTDLREPRPFWMTMFASEPPLHKLTIRFHFTRTLQMLDECIEKRHTTERTLRSEEGITVGEVLKATHDCMEWPKIRLKHALGRGRVALILPTPGMDVCYASVDSLHPLETSSKEAEQSRASDNTAPLWSLLRPRAHTLTPRHPLHPT